MQPSQNVPSARRAVAFDLRPAEANQGWRTVTGLAGRFAFYGVLVLAAFVALFPIVWLLLGSVQSAREIYGGTTLIPATFQWSNYVTAWNEGHFKTYLPNSLFYTATAVAGILVVSSMAGYALARMEFPGRNAVLVLILAILIIPAPASFIA